MTFETHHRVVYKTLAKNLHAKMQKQAARSVNAQGQRVQAQEMLKMEMFLRTESFSI